MELESRELAFGLFGKFYNLKPSLSPVEAKGCFWAPNITFGIISDALFMSNVHHLEMQCIGDLHVLSLCQTLLTHRLRIWGVQILYIVA